MKVDIEGHELHLFKIRDDIFKRVSVYIVEVHSYNLLRSMLEKCARNNYKVRDINPINPPLRMVWAERRT